MKVDILYGFHPVYEAFRAGRRTFHEIYISRQTSNKRVELIRQTAQDKKIAVEELNPAKIQAIAGSAAHQGIAASVSAYPLLDVGELIESVTATRGSPFLLLLDQIVDPHNLGAILRTALCTGVDGVIIPRDRSASPSPAVSKISSGALEHIGVARVNNLVRCVESLKEKDLWIAGLDPKAPQSIYNATLTGALGLIVGGEEKDCGPWSEKNAIF